MFKTKTIVRAAALLFTPIVLSIFWASKAHADKIEFGDGNILYGTVSSLADGTLVFSNSFSKEVKIPVADIKSVTTDHPVTIKLTNDSILTGPLVTMSDGTFGIKLDLIGTAIPIEWDQVKTINEPPGRWTGNLAIGGTLQTGNTERSSFSLNGATKREWEHDRFALRILYNYAEVDGSITSRNIYGSIKFDHFFTDNFYSLLSVELLKDEFKDVKLRSIISLGAGYRIWNDAIKTLDLEAGVAYFSEDLEVGVDDQFIAGRIAGNFSYKVLENLLFKDHALYYPSFENFAEYKARNEASLSSVLGRGWTFKLSHILDYDSTPAMGIEKTDQQWIFALQYDF